MGATHVAVASIVIASHNYGRFLGEAVESALGQTSPGVEVIVVDDGSTDDSRDVLGRVRGRATLIFKERGGQASAWNAGVLAARGRFVIFLDADDRLEPTAVERVAGVFEDGRVAKAHWPLAVIDEAGRPAGRLVPPHPVSTGDLRSCVLEDGPGGHPGHVWPPSSGNAWARWFLDRVLPVPEAAFRTSPDLYLATLAPLYGLVAGIAEPQGCWRVHGGNSSWMLPFDARLDRAVSLWESCAEALARHCRVQGIEPDLDRWRRRGWYHRIRRALDDLCRVVPPGATFVLADEAEWDTDDIVRARRRVPITERDGVYWGPPADDEAAIAELERLRHQGAEYLVVAWPAFWWLDHYRGWTEHLRSRHATLLETGDIRVFGLRARDGLASA
jgi:glycosyltransferase involved in cell wall biosynthesis